MNKVIKILLSIVIVSLSALVVPLKGHSKNIKTESVAVQAAVKSTEMSLENFVIEQPVSINFEIDTAIEEMNQKMAEIESIEDKKEWFIAYKSIIEEYSYIIDPPETIYEYFTEEELDLLFHVVQAEIGDECYSFEQKANVASVVFNRLYHEKFPDALSEILVYDQFSPISNGRYKEVEVSEDTILACEYAFEIEDTTDGCLFFDSNNTLNYQFVFNDSAHNFYKYREE
ncbi:MAG: cell wall hydrolase [Lachnospiraceae bacterium]